MSSPTELRITTPDVTALVYPAAEPHAGAMLVLAHGAGAGQRSPFMVAAARALAAAGVETVTFNFPYAEQRRRLPDRRPVLEDCYRRVVAVVRGRTGDGNTLFVGGKSMGGRIATYLAAGGGDPGIAGVVLLGYPLHPPGRPEERRDSHFPAVTCPTLFVQGSRDAFGTPGELASAMRALGAPATLHVVEGGDHSFKLARAPKTRQAEAMADVYRVVARWIASLAGG